MEHPAITIIVAPFDDLALRDPDAMLARGFVQDLAVELSRFPQIAIITADSKEDAISVAVTQPKEAKCGVLTGSFRPWDTGIRIHVRLEDAQSRHHLWAGRYDGPMDKIHDEITVRIVNALAAGVDQSLLIRARRRPPRTLEAYECWLRGMDCVQRGTAESDAEALQFFERALKLDPHYAEAHAGISLAHFNEWSCQLWGQWETREAAAYAAATRAVEMDPDNARIQVILGRIEQYRREFDRAAPRIERALALAPNDASILVQLALYFAYQGDAERGRQFGDRALALHPLAPGWYFAYASLPYFTLGRFEDYIHLASKVPPHSIVDTPAFLAAASALLGRQSDAERHLEAFRSDFHLRIATGRSADDEELLSWLMHVNPFRDPAHSKLLADGVRLAGLTGSGKRQKIQEPVPWSIANTFRKEGAAWTLVFEHQAVTLPDLRGLHDLARLLSRPGESFSCQDLAGVQVESRGIESTDLSALRAYRQRLAEIDTDLAEAEDCGDQGVQTRLREERDALLAEVGRVTGLGGRTREAGGSHERARTAVTWRIRHAVRRIAVVHEALGNHLKHSIRTGAECGYFPERPVAWYL